ncbi:hypothetical protein Tco_1564995, partial [Tanacetum coccineum]
MTEPTMDEYINKTLGYAYELKGKFLDDLRNIAFSGMIGEDAIKHIENFLKIVDPLDLPNVHYERLKLSIFPVSLTVNANKFIGKYYMPSRTGKIMGTKAMWDSTNVVFENWLATKFTNHMMMDPLWDYWKKGNDQEVLIDEAFSDLEETYEDREHEIAEIFRIKTDIFNFETPLCITFNEFNYLL